MKRAVNLSDVVEVWLDGDALSLQEAFGSAAGAIRTVLRIEDGQIASGTMLKEKRGKKS